MADDVVPELDNFGRAGRHTNIHRTMARRRAGHYLQGSRTSLLSAQSYLFRDYRLVVMSAARQPGESLAPGGVAAAARQDPRYAARRRLPVPFVDGGGSDQLVSALLDPHRQTGDAIPLTYDDGRELRDQVIDRPRACASTARASAWPTRLPTCKPSFA